MKPELMLPKYRAIYEAARKEAYAKLRVETNIIDAAKRADAAAVHMVWSAAIKEIVEARVTGAPMDPSQA